jgi:hypothetical protein
MRASVRAAIVIAAVLVGVRAAAAQTDVVIAIDLSKSMKINDPNGNRFIGADQFMTMFSVYGQNRGAVVAFGNSASEVIKLDSLSFDQAANGYKPILDKLGYDDWTELGIGLKVSRGAFGQSGRRKSVILISDGIVEGNPNTRGVSKEQAREQALRELWGDIVPGLKRASINVYTVGLYSVPGESMSPAQKDGETVLQKIADETGGFYTHVNNPEEFSQIYRQMLVDIGQPAGVAELTADKNSIVLTAADEGVIVFGPLRFIVKAPNGLTYTTNAKTPDTPVKQNFVEYSNNVGILFLGRPDDIGQNEGAWTGKWSVERLSGPGEVTYISNVRLNRAEGLPARREFFLNEFYPVEYRFDTQPGFDSEALLKKCRAEYTLVPQGHSAARPAMNAIGREGNTFKGEHLLDHEGDYILEVKILYEDVEKWTKRERFHVNRTPLVEIVSPDGPASKGEGFSIEAKENHAAFTSDAADIKGLVDGKMTYSLRYGSGQPTSLPPVNADSGVYRASDLEFKKAGDLEIIGLLNGKLVAQRAVEDGEPVISNYNVKALAVKRLKVENSWMAAVLPAGATSIGLIASLLGIYGFIQNRRFNLLDRAALAGTRTIPLEPERKSRMRVFRGQPEVSIGGPASDADVKEPGLNKGGPRPVMQLGVDALGKGYYIVRTGDLDVYVNRDPLQENEKKAINPLDLVIVREKGQHQDLMKFKFVD